MKLAFWLIGTTCSGKSTHAKALSEKLNIKWISLDTVEDRIKIDGMTREDGYSSLFKKSEDVIIVDGIVPFNFKLDMDMVMRHLNNYKIIYVIVSPPYEELISNIKIKRSEFPDVDVKILTKEQYISYNKNLVRRVGRFFRVANTEDIFKLEEDIRNLKYQHKGFTDIKWKQLQIPSKGNSLLDLGCSSCQYEEYFLKDGGVKYKGLDSNLSYLINKNAEWFDLNELEKWQNPYDVVVCSSVMHYIHDKEKFIKECARLANKLCVLEIPLYKGEGEVMHLGPRGLYFPTRELFEKWISKYFNNFKCLGESIVEDGSYRLIYHCYD